MSKRGGGQGVGMIINSEKTIREIALIGTISQFCPENGSESLYVKYR